MVTRTPSHFNELAFEFLTERHLGTFTTLRKDGSPHVTAVGFTYDSEARIARVICDHASQKALNAGRSGVGVVAQVDGRRWLSLEGTARVLGDAESVADAVQRYTRRYRVPRENPTRVVVEIAVTRVLGSSSLFH